MSALPNHHKAYIDSSLIRQGSEDGPLKGLTFSLKDLFDVAGTKTGFGNPVWLETHDEAAETAAAVQACLDAGATLRGKTAMDELAYSLNGENFHYGTPVNPACPDRIPGGSSSGAAVSVGARDVDFALGSDTGGSVRIPASYCGLFGMRPTHGRVSTHATRPLAPSYCTVGWFARDAALFQKVGNVLLAHKPPAAPLTLKRWIVAKDAFNLALPETTKALYDALSVSFTSVTEVLGQPAELDIAPGLADPQLASLSQWFDVFRISQAGEIWKTHGSWVSSHEPRFGPGIKERFAMAASITPQQLAVATEQRTRIRAHLEALLGSDGFLAVPTAPGPAPLCNTPSDQLDDWRKRMISLTCIAGIGGLPQINLPIGSVDGCPVGLGLIGPPDSDEALLELAVKLDGVLKISK